MFENTTRLQVTDPIFCTGWKHICHLLTLSFFNLQYWVTLSGFNTLNFSPWPAILWYFQTLPHIWLLQWLKCSGWRKSCCVFKSCKIFGLWPAILRYFQTLPCGWLQIEELKYYPVEHCLFCGFNRLNFLGCWQFCGTFKNRNHWVASTT